MLWTVIQVVTIYFGVILMVVACVDMASRPEWDEQQTYEEYLRDAHWNGHSR